MPFVPLTQATSSDISAARRLLSNRPLFRLYFEAGLDAVQEGQNNRSILLASSGRGMVLSIDFSGITIRTSIGVLSDEEVIQAVSVARAAELHLEPEHLEVAQRMCAGRITTAKHLRYYRLDTPCGFLCDPRCQPLTRAHAAMVEAFYRRLYPSTIFSDWMLDQPFWGLCERGELVSCGGVVVLSSKLGMANLGNFLTDPRRRGNGLAKAVARTLVRHLEDEGFSTFILATTEDNTAAQHVYEPLGFMVIETRPQLSLAPPG